MIDVDNGSSFSVLGPLRQDDGDENNNSLVLRLSTPEGDMLLTGDMEQEEESDLLVKGVFTEAAVLKVAHHGRNDTTSTAFLRQVKPQWAVISTNTQTHPNTLESQVLQAFGGRGRKRGRNPGRAGWHMGFPVLGQGQRTAHWLGANAPASLNPHRMA